MLFNIPYLDALALSGTPLWPMLELLNFFIAFFAGSIAVAASQRYSGKVRTYAQLLGIAASLMALKELFGFVSVAVGIEDAMPYDLMETVALALLAYSFYYGHTKLNVIEL